MRLLGNTKYRAGDDTTGFIQASLAAYSIYNQAIQDYTDKIQDTLQQHSTSRGWCSLIKSLTGSASLSCPATPPASQLAGYFSSKLSQPANLLPVPPPTNSHISQFFRFRFKISHVRHVLTLLNTTKSIGGDNVNPHVHL